MNRLIALIIVLILTTSLTACSDKVDAEKSGASTLRQGNTDFIGVVDDIKSFVQEHEQKTISLQKDIASVFIVDEENISVEITATNAYVLNANTDYVLFQINSDEPISPASTSKMLTALTVLAYCSPSDIFVVGSEIDLIASDSSRAWLNKGDSLTVKQLLAAMLLPSGNDASYTLAVNTGKIISGKNDLMAEQYIKTFVEAMNQRAKEIGAVSSNFTNPDGYDESGQYTTAFDLAQIAKSCLDSDILSEIMGSYKISQKWSNGREVTYTNTNELINPKSQYYYSKAVGFKTGSTKAAGDCLVSAASINGQSYICVVMGSSAGVRFMDSLTVFNAIDKEIPLAPIKKADSPVPHPVAPGELGGIE